MRYLAVLVLFFALPVFALKQNGVQFDDKAKVGEKELVINGAALRRKKKFGIKWKVYVGALYLEEKSSDSDVIINSDQHKRVIMHFLMSVKRKDLIEAHRSGYETNCVEDCKNASLFSQFKPLITAMGSKDRMILDFYKDKVVVSGTGSSAKTGELTSPALVKNLMAMFINKKNPPTKSFRKGMLGL